MMINGEFVRREIAGDILLVPTGDTALRFNGMITLTETASVIWDELEKGASREDIVQRLLDEYDIDRETAAADADEFLDLLTKHNFLVFKTD